MDIVQEYQLIKEKIVKLEADKIKTATELEIKEKEIASIEAQLNELGITDLENLDKIVEDKKIEFETQLLQLKEQLDNVSGT